MKTLKLMTAAIVLGATSIAAQAGPSDREILTNCKSELSAIYGVETRVKLKGMKNNRAGKQMRIHAIPGEGDSVMVTCWMDKEGGVNVVDSEGVALLAPTQGSEEQVSLAE